MNSASLSSCLKLLAKGNLVPIELRTFHATYRSLSGHPPNPDQCQSIDADPAEPLFVVAGPGTGKTTVLALRILKLILVDGTPPNGILATTFTVKAAAELRSRILGWGFQLIEELLTDTNLSLATKAWLKTVDINQVLTGTIDSICERLLRDFRDPGSQPPVLADDFVIKTLLLREGLFPDRRFADADLEELLLGLHGGSRFGFHVGRKNDLLLNIWDRRYQDQIEWNQFVTGGGTPAEQQALQVINDATLDYRTALNERGMVDFALLENEVLDRLCEGGFVEFTEQIQIVLVDEYQDSNLLQERLYFQLAQACGGALTVVGDDDQSLYRFRGATVELFSDFEARYQAVFGQQATKVFLRTNYRSTQNVIQFVNDYAVLDDAYQAARVAAKPALAHGPTSPPGVPVLGMFRPDIQALATDLADFIHQVFRGNGYQLPDGTVIERAHSGGDVGDCALLCSSPAEFNAGDRVRLPGLLRDQLNLRAPAIPTFNPRGQDLTQIPLVSHFGGLLLECLDPGAVMEAQVNGLPQDVLQVFASWRNSAVEYVNSALAPQGLADFAIGWADRDPQRGGYGWPKEISVLELIYALAHYFPALHDDVEGQVYLEVFARQLEACVQVGKFKGRVLHDPNNQGLGDASIKELIRDFLGPIASGSVSVNEDLMDVFPRDRVSVLSIHQSKGLEFPLTIVDVGSDFKSNHHGHAFKRFPRSGGPTHRMEDLVRPYSSDPILRGAPRTDVDRAFDDLIRQYFVAFSRAEQVLLLVGLYPQRGNGAINRVPNVAQGWARDGGNPWGANRPYLDI